MTLPSASKGRLPVLLHADDEPMTLCAVARLLDRHAVLLPPIILSRLVRYRRNHPGLRILVLTGLDGLSVAQQCLGAGAMGIVSKLAAREELPDAIRAVHAGRTFASPSIGSATDTSDPRLAKLGERTIRILGYLRRGLSYLAIAALEGISVKAVEYHERQLRKPLGMPKGRGGWDLVEM